MIIAREPSAAPTLVELVVVKLVVVKLVVNRVERVSGDWLRDQPAPSTTVHVEVAKPSPKPLLAATTSSYSEAVEELFVKVIATSLAFLLELLVLRLIRRLLPV
ncbi:MAG: hypothetical protein JO115_19600 [Pseudonocardiales bacterium]|nr:hypothetical protein [Pseudonocardiales bacterium]